MGFDLVLVLCLNVATPPLRAVGRSSKRIQSEQSAKSSSTELCSVFVGADCVRCVGPYSGVEPL